MRYPWLFSIPLIIFITIVIAEVLHFLKKKDFKKQHRRASLIAHTRQIRELPEYEKAQKYYRLLLWFAAIVFTISTSSAIILASRPVIISEIKNENYNRDIMICLDVSGSMQSIGQEVLRYFEKIVNELEGERIGVVIFNGVYATMSPLTDDYLAISEVLEDINDNYSEYGSRLSPNGAASQIGLGLAGCVDSFDKINESDRSRSIIIATDNMSGEPILDLLKAAQMAKGYDITVYGLYAKNSIISNIVLPSESEFSDATSLTGGTYYSVIFDTDKDVVKQIIQAILKTEAKKYDKVGHLAKTDSPSSAAIVFGISTIVLLIIIWRLRI